MFLNQKFVLSSETSKLSKYYSTDIEGNNFVSRFGYSYLVTDMQNIFTHLELADVLMNDEHLCVKYAHCVGSMQGTFKLYSY